MSHGEADDLSEQWLALRNAFPADEPPPGGAGIEGDAVAREALVEAEDAAWEALERAQEAHLEKERQFLSALTPEQRTRIDALNETANAPLSAALLELTEPFTRSWRRWLERPAAEVDLDAIDRLGHATIKACRDRVRAEGRPRHHTKSTLAAALSRTGLHHFSGDRFGLLVLMRQTRLEPRHQLQILKSTMTEEMFAPTQTLEQALGTVVEWPLGVIAEVESICYRAAKEGRVADVLGDIVAKWRRLEFDVRDHQDTGTFIVGNFELLYDQVDNSQVKVDCLCGSPFAAHCLQELQQLKAALAAARAFLDVLRRLQCAYVNLEGAFATARLGEDVFSAPLISQFDEADMMYRQIMDRMRAELKVSTVVAKERDGAVSRTIRLLHDVEQGMDGALLKQCLAIRAVLSNDEMLRLLQSKRPSNLRDNLLRTCLDGQIARIVVADDGTETIVAVVNANRRVGALDEREPPPPIPMMLSAPLPTRGVYVITWLQQLFLRVAQTRRKLLQEALLREQSGTIFAGDVQASYPQATMMAQRVKFTRFVEAALQLPIGASGAVLRRLLAEAEEAEAQMGHSLDRKQTRPGPLAYQQRLKRMMLLRAHQRVVLRLLGGADKETKPSGGPPESARLLAVESSQQRDRRARCRVCAAWVLVTSGGLTPAIVRRIDRGVERWRTWQEQVRFYASSTRGEPTCALASGVVARWGNRTLPVGLATSSHTWLRHDVHSASASDYWLTRAIFTAVRQASSEHDRGNKAGGGTGELVLIGPQATVGVVLDLLAGLGWTHLIFNVGSGLSFQKNKSLAAKAAAWLRPGHALLLKDFDRSPSKEDARACVDAMRRRLATCPGSLVVYCMSSATTGEPLQRRSNSTTAAAAGEPAGLHVDEPHMRKKRNKQAEMQGFVLSILGETAVRLCLENVVNVSKIEMPGDNKK